MKIVLASHNEGKRRELQGSLASLQIELIAEQSLGIESVPETGHTFIENALIKARHASLEANLPALADDSGLIVPSLKGAPGIHSARYAGPKAENADNISKLLKALKHESNEARSAYFYCVLVYLEHALDPTPLVCEGRWYGRILETPVGSQGFGYDPIFWVPEKNCAAAELTLEEKNQVSHRGKALALLQERLREKLCMR